MLSIHEIKQIVEATTKANKEIFVTKEEFRDAIIEIKYEFSTLQTTVDRALLKLNVHDDEIKIINHRLRQLENPA